MVDVKDCHLELIGYGKFETLVRMIGGKWKLRIIFALASEGTLRYGELRRILNPVTHKMLTASLRELEADELLVRTEYPQVPPKVEYRLSQKGRDLQPAVEKLCEWIVANDIQATAINER